jgi:hypothetical protein
MGDLPTLRKVTALTFTLNNGSWQVLLVFDNGQSVIVPIASTDVTAIAYLWSNDFHTNAIDDGSFIEFQS